MRILLQQFFTSATEMYILQTVEERVLRRMWPMALGEPWSSMCCSPSSCAPLGALPPTGLPPSSSASVVCSWPQDSVGTTICVWTPCCPVSHAPEAWHSLYTFLCCPCSYSSHGDHTLPQRFLLNFPINFCYQFHWSNKTIRAYFKALTTACIATYLLVRASVPAMRFPLPSILQICPTTELCPQGYGLWLAQAHLSLPHINIISLKRPFWIPHLHPSPGKQPVIYFTITHISLFWCLSQV